MLKGQKFVVNTQVKMQGKTFKAGTIFEIYMAATRAKENHVAVVCGKNGKMKSVMNPSNHAGLTQEQLQFGLENETISLVEVA